MQSILLIDDDLELCELLVRWLSQEGFQVSACHDGSSARTALASQPPAAVVLDVMLPDGSGLELLKQLRSEHPDLPVLMLSARGEPLDRILGLELGADDYLAKPFDLPELEARVRALLRRGTNSTPYLEHGLLRFDTVGRRVFHDRKPLDLSPRELAVLELLLMREGRVVSKEQIVNHLYGWGDEVSSNAVEVYIHGLRKKLGPELVLNVRGVGYLEPLGCEIRTVRGMGYLMERDEQA